MTPKFKSRYVLGEGYPFVGVDGVGVVDKLENNIDLYFPRNFIGNDPSDRPIYRLVLERVRREKKK